VIVAIINIAFIAFLVATKSDRNLESRTEREEEILKRERGED